MQNLQVINSENQVVIAGTILEDSPSSEMLSFVNKMTELYPDILKRAEDVILAKERLPEVVDNDTDSGKLGDFIKQVVAADKSIDACRKEEKEVYLAGSRRVDGFFNRYREELAKVKEIALKVQAAYIKRKEDEERRRREEEAARLRAEAEAKAAEAARIAAEAEAKRKEAEERERLAREEATRKQREIEEKARIEREKAEAEIAELKRKAAEAERIDAETKRQIKEAEERAKEAEKVAKAENKELQKQVKAQEQEIKALTKEAINAERESVKTLDSAVRSENQSIKMDRLASGKGSDLARTRGFEGSVTTIRTVKVGIITSREDLDLETLRPYFRDDDLQFAVDQFVKAYGDTKTIKGVTVVEEDKAIVR